MRIYFRRASRPPHVSCFQVELVFRRRRRRRRDESLVLETWQTDGRTRRQLHCAVIDGKQRLRESVVEMWDPDDGLSESRLARRPTDPQWRSSRLAYRYMRPRSTRVPTENSVHILPWWCLIILNEVDLTNTGMFHHIHGSSTSVSLIALRSLLQQNIQS